MAPPDYGPPEARVFRLLLTSRSDREVDPPSCLFSRGFLDQSSYDAGRRYAATVAVARHGGVWDPLGVGGRPMEAHDRRHRRRRCAGLPHI
jgi:hypothetical protein